MSTSFFLFTHSPVNNPPAQSALKIPDIDKMPPLPEWLNEYAASQGLTSSKEKEEKDARFVEDFVDDLTVAIALREWDEAIRMVEDGESLVFYLFSLNAKSWLIP